jgi:hypothetical protein
VGAEGGGGSGGDVGVVGRQWWHRCRDGRMSLERKQAAAAAVAMWSW